jgi:catechol 2,3-dioxygenase-like lactoylglutathione lyase family enzyme
MRALLRPGRPTVKLNHLDLQVSDVPRTVALFEQLLGFELQSSRASTAIAILSDGEGFTLVLQRKKNEADAYPEGSHFGFLLDDPEAVRRFHARAVAAGLVEVSELIENGRGVLVYCRTGDGLLFEVSWQRPRRPLAPGGAEPAAAGSTGAASGE